VTIQFRNGRLPHDPRPARLLLADYQSGAFTAPPAADWAGKVRSWPMLLNDQIGDCTAAGAGHVAQQVNWYGRDRNTPVTDQDTLAFYEAVSGYRPGDPSTDVGATLQDALDRWHTTGIGGNTIAAFAQINAADLGAVRACIATFGSVYCGMWFPQSAEDQFNAGRPWTVVKRSKNLGGHCVPIMAYDADSFTCVTWGQVQRMDVPFFQAQLDEVWAPVDLDWLRATGISPSGIDTANLNADYQALTGRPGPFPDVPAPEPTPTPSPAGTADETFARQLHAWLNSRPRANRALQDEASAWLAAKNL
jgi:hypothetical protein